MTNETIPVTCGCGAKILDARFGQVIREADLKCPVCGRVNTVSAMGQTLTLQAPQTITLQALDLQPTDFMITDIVLGESMTNPTDPNLTMPGPELSKPVLRSGPPALMEARAKLVDLMTTDLYPLAAETIEAAIDAFEKAVREATLRGQ